MSLPQDNIPLRDPERLFDSVEYRQSGSVFWSDLNKDHRKALGFQFPLTHSGQCHFPDPWTILLGRALACGSWPAAL